MATVLTVLLTDDNLNPDPANNAQIVLTNPLIGPNTWASNSAVLVSAGGGVDDSDHNKLACNDQGATIVTLNGATWNSAQGASGDADCHGCNGSIQKIWTVTNRA